MTKKPETPEAKTFSLKPSEKNYLEFIRSHTQAIFAGALSNIASERIGYNVTQLTQFELTDNFDELKISELVLPETKEESPVVTGK